MKAVILAAGIGSRLAPLTNDRPKVLVDILGRSFLVRQLELLKAAEIPPRDVVVVGGYKLDLLKSTLAAAGYDVTVVFNDHFDTWNNFYSLGCAAPALAGHDFLQLDGDVLLDDKVLPRMISAEGDALIAVDTSANLDEETMKAKLRSDGTVEAISKKLDPAQCAGEYIGVTKLTADAARAVFADLAKFPDEMLTHEYYEHAFHRLSGDKRVPFRIVDVRDCAVLEIDTVEDLRRAEALLEKSGGAVTRRS